MKHLFKILLLISLSAQLSAFDKYSLHCDKLVLEASLDTAFAQVGILESGNNRGEVEKYTKYLSLPKGSAYCAAGVYYCFALATNNTNDIPIPRTGVATKLFTYAKRHGKRRKNIPAKHDLIIWCLPGSWRGHVERIYKVEKAGWVRSIAFNTKKGNKEGVFKQRRNLYHILGRLKVLGLVGFSTKVRNA